MSWKRHKAKCALLEWFDQTDAEKFVSEHKEISFRESDNDVKVEIVDCKEPAMSEFNDIDIPTLPKPIGSLQELHPEFAKVLNENFLELISDDAHTENRTGCIDNLSDSRELETLDKLENHISPNCKVENV